MNFEEYNRTAALIEQRLRDNYPLFKWRVLIAGVEIQLSSPFVSDPFMIRGSIEVAKIQLGVGMDIDQVIYNHLSWDELDRNIRHKIARSLGELIMDYKEKAETRLKRLENNINQIR